MPPLKNSINTDSVRTLASGLSAAWPAFPAEEFVAAATAGLDGLELKDRVRYVTRALADHLTLPFPQAAKALSDAAAHVRLDMFSGWPATDYLGTYGLDHLDEAMAAIAVITPFATGEMAVRPYLGRYRDDAVKIMIGWTESDNDHIRRLASEGARPRLPWATQVPWLRQEGITTDLLDRLREDPSEYVRRSVANHVNDIAVDHPEAAVALLTRWRSEGGEHVEWIIRHGLRGLLRSGNPAALALMGAAHGSGRVTSLSLDSETVPIGGHLRFTAVAAADAAGPLFLKYEIRREGSKRVFHLAQKTAKAAGEEFPITKAHSFKPVTTRREPPGPYTVNVIVNGVVRGSADFTLTPAAD